MAGVESPTPPAWRAAARPGRLREAGLRETRPALDQAGGEGHAGEVGAAPASGLIADAVQVRADRAYADVQLFGDLRIGVPAGDQGEQLSFPGAERIQARCRGRR